MKDNFNPLEKTIARLMSRSPVLKKIAKLLYSRFVYLFKRKKYKYSSGYKIENVPCHSYNDENFFGYYDKKIDNGNGIIIVNRSKFDTSKAPKNYNKIFIDIYDLSKNEYLIYGEIETNAFNWQQGARAHWLDDARIAYNYYDDQNDSYITRIYSITNRCIEEEIPLPVQDSYKDQFILSISYKKLAMLRPDYGYFCHSKNSETDLEGIWKYDLITKEKTLLLSLDNISRFSFSECNNKSDLRHKLNHIMVSPNGKYFIFMHRYYTKNNQRFDRLLISDISGNTIRVLADNCMVSHCFWYDDNSVLGYLRDENGIDAYWVINTENGTYEKFNNGVFDNRGDGHPSVLGDRIVTDTYPDKSRMQSLYLTVKGSDEDIKLGEFYHGFKFDGECRCDLHPRFSNCGNYVFFDSVFDDKRRLYYINIERIPETLSERLS